MATDSCGNILIGTQNGLFFFDQNNNSLRHILIDEQSCSSQLNYITSIVHDKTDSFWIGTANGFIIKYNNNLNLFEKFETFREPNGQSRNILKLFVDSENNLWIADLNGLHLFNIKTDSWDRDFQKKYGPVFSNLLITGIGRDADNLIWITTDGKGVFILDKKNTKPVNILNLPYSEGSLSSNGLSSLYYDESGIIWIGTANERSRFL